MSSYRQLRYRAILNEANPSYSREEIGKRWKDILKNGVFLKGKKLFYWLDVDPNQRNEMNDCYVVLASSLTFTDRYDNWKTESITPPGIVVMNLSEKVRWLEVKGDFSTVKLQAYRNYNVSFLVKVNKNHPDFPSNGLQLELSYVIPNANRSETRRHEITADKNNNNDKWIELNAGKFYHYYFTLGTIYFSMKNTDATWKAGISVLGVCIKPGEGSDRINTEEVTDKILHWEKYHYNK